MRRANVAPRSIRTCAVPDAAATASPATGTPTSSLTSSSVTAGQVGHRVGDPSGHAGVLGHGVAPRGAPPPCSAGPDVTSPGTDEPAVSATVGVVIEGEGRHAVGWADVADGVRRHVRAAVRRDARPLAVRGRGGSRGAGAGRRGRDRRAGRPGGGARRRGHRRGPRRGDARPRRVTAGRGPGAAGRAAGPPVRRRDLRRGPRQLRRQPHPRPAGGSPRAGSGDRARWPGRRDDLAVGPEHPVPSLGGRHRRQRRGRAAVGTDCPPTWTSRGPARDWPACSPLPGCESSTPGRWSGCTAPRRTRSGAAPLPGVGGIGTVVTSQSDEVRDAMRSAYDRLVLPLVHDGELVLPTEALLAVGTR